MNTSFCITVLVLVFYGVARAEGSSFTAYMTDTKLVGRTAIISFDEVKLNQGENYDPMTGIYTCPVDGLMAVSLGLTAVNSTNFSVCLYNNGALETRMALAQTNVLYSGVVMVHCAYDDHLYAKVCRGSSGGRLVGGHSSFFSAQLIGPNVDVHNYRQQEKMERPPPNRPMQAVSAYLTYRTRAYSSRKLVFDDVDSGVNVGQGYDNTTGTFTCLYSGVYEFSLRVTSSFSSSSSSYYMAIQIRHSYASVLELKLSPSQPNQSGTVLVSCQAGDDVYPYISAVYSYSNYIEHDKKSLFTAHLISVL